MLHRGVGSEGWVGRVSNCLTSFLKANRTEKSFSSHSMVSYSFANRNTKCFLYHCNKLVGLGQISSIPLYPAGSATFFIEDATWLILCSKIRLDMVQCAPRARRKKENNKSSVCCVPRRLRSITLVKFQAGGYLYTLPQKCPWAVLSHLNTL